MISEQEREAVLDWMSDIDYRSHHNTVLDRLMEGTGNWLFRKKQYSQWDSNPRSSLLWLRGDGKSFAVGNVILEALTFRIRICSGHWKKYSHVRSSEDIAEWFSNHALGLP